MPRMVINMDETRLTTIAQIEEFLGGIGQVEFTAHGGDVRNLSSPTIARLSTPGITGASAIIAVSRYLATELRESARALPPVHVIDMGVDMDRFRPVLEVFFAR